MELYHVQVNHLTDPMGFLMKRVCFSWKVRGATGTRQVSARAVVAEDEDLSRVLLYTGFDPAADSLGWRVPLGLRPRTRYYFQITVRSDAEEEASSAVHWFETGKMDEPWQAQWVTCDSVEKRHPWFEKEIAPREKVTQARLYICGLGLYEAYFNGTRIGNEYLTPYSNDYNRWMQAQTFDVTQQLQTSGTLSVLLGNGWYKARFGFAAHEDVGFYGNEWKLIAELHLAYTDGTEEIIGTDDSWTVRRSRITFSNLYDGERRDDTLPELHPERPILCPPPKGTLTDRMSTPVTVHETFAPVELLHTPKGELVLDMGQEFTGSFRLKVDVPKGQAVHIQTGEILQQGCFYNENLRTAKSEYWYISNGEPVVLQPHFTFYGYRYVKIDGIPDLKKEDFTGLALYSEIPQRGTMRTGHALLNQFLSNVRWGLKSNFLDVPTDCPQRDERMGWTGDAQVFSPTAMYLQDVYAFYAKYLYDMYQEQLDLGGKVPDVVPSCGVESCACVWGDAACIIPWNLYRFYGDKGILEDQFPSMKAWVDYISQVDGTDHGWRRQFHYGDWLALDNQTGDAEQVLGATDEGFIADLYYAASAEIVSKAAKVLGDGETEAKYASLAQKQIAEVRREYYSATGRCCVKTQTALLLTLKYGLTENRALAIEQLTRLLRQSTGKLQTGFVGTPLLCQTLSDNGLDDFAWKLLLNEDYPGWLHEVKLGATTVWERWNSLLDDGTISGISMNSMNHYAYGSVTEWLFRRAAGIDAPEGAPGFRHVEFRPNLNWDVRELEAVYDSPAGEYRSAWKLTDRDHVELSFTVPFGCTAALILPRAPESAYEVFDEVQDGVCHLKPGTYSVSYGLTPSLPRRFSVDSTSRELRADQAARAAVADILPLDDAPLQYLDYSLREVAERFGSFVKPEELDELDARLAAVESVRDMA